MISLVEYEPLRLQPIIGARADDVAVRRVVRPKKPGDEKGG
jgi:hypothetical protein